MNSGEPFTFVEVDHLTRIHIKLGLEDVGVVVAEDENKLAVSTEPK
jgi:hypothetical protein